MSRPAKLYTHKGVSLTLTEWAEVAQLGRTTLVYRLKAGWPLRDALWITPVFGQFVHNDDRWTQQRKAA